MFLVRFLAYQSPSEKGSTFRGKKNLSEGRFFFSFRIDILKASQKHLGRNVSKRTFGYVGLDWLQSPVTFFSYNLFNIPLK